MRKRLPLIVLAIVLLAIVMRTPITAVGPLIGRIGQEYALSGTVAGLITTIPLVVFAVTSQPIAQLAHRVGTRSVLFAGASTLLAAILIRSIPGVAPFFVGTVLVGLGISAVNVLLPVLIKEELPLRIGVMTALYTTVMEAGSIVSSAASVPWADAIGWHASLAVWAVPGIVACLVAWRLMRLPTLQASVGEKNALSPTPDTTGRSDRGSFFSSSAAWWLIVYMALQSLLFYCIVAWLPTLMVDKGITEQTAGYVAAFFQFLNIPGSLVTPILAQKLHSQSVLGILSGAVYVVGLLLILTGDSLPVLLVGTALCALCAGASISLAMALIGIRTRDARDSNELSGIVQAFGYGLAALGPFAMGVLFDASGSWTAPVILLVAVAAALAVSGKFAGEPGYIG